MRYSVIVIRHKALVTPAIYYVIYPVFKATLNELDVDSLNAPSFVCTVGGVWTRVKEMDHLGPQVHSTTSTPKMFIETEFI